MDKSKKIYDWFESHPLIKKNAILLMAGWNSGNYERARASGWAIPARYIAKIERIIKHYGYE